MCKLKQESGQGHGGGGVGERGRRRVGERRGATGDQRRGPWAGGSQGEGSIRLCVVAAETSLPNLHLYGA